MTKTKTARLLDKVARAEGLYGRVCARACSGVLLERRRNGRERRGRWFWRGKVEAWHSGASPGRDKDAGEASGQAGGVAAAWLARWHSTEQLGCAGQGRRP